MTTLDLADGSVFAGRYRIVRAIAKGGMGAVYEVLHLETERRRALKVMLPHLVSNDQLRERFRQEARVAAKVESAFIVDVFDAGIDESTTMPFLVMELLRGEELGKRLARLGHFSPRDVVAYLGQTALALDKTHQARIVHRDLKPENLFLAEQDGGPPRIKVLDFGIAKLVAEQGTAANATQSIGTPLYMAPEQFLPNGKVSAATDLFSLGMMAYTLLVGSAYWREEREVQANVYAFVAAVMSGPTEAPTARALRQGIELPAAFDAWFARATAKDPAQRFARATEAIVALANVFGMAWALDGSAGRTTVTDGSTLPEQGNDKATMVLVGKTPGLVESRSQPTALGLSSTHSGGARADTSSVRQTRGRRWSVLVALVVMSALLIVGFLVPATKHEQPQAQTASSKGQASVPSVVSVDLPRASSAQPMVVEPRIDIAVPITSASVSTNPAPATEVAKRPIKPNAASASSQTPKLFREWGR